MRSLLFVGAVFGLCGAAFAQNDQLSNLQAHQAAAEAQAAQPGDEDLTCDQLMTEMGAIGTDPTMQGNAAALGQWAQQTRTQGEDQRQQAMTQVAPNLAASAAAAMIPGAGMVTQPVQMAQQQQIARQAEEQTLANQAAMADASQHSAAMMPGAARGMHLYELAQQRQCTFLQEDSSNAAH